MSVNRDKWHLTIFVEDPAYADIATGFKRLLPQMVQRQVEVREPPVGGRIPLYSQAKEAARKINDKQIILVLTDFDSKLKTLGGSDADESADNDSIEERCEEFDKIRACGDSERTFVIGPLMEAEDLVNEMASVLPAINRKDIETMNSEIRCGELFSSADMKCREGLWGGRQLRHYYNQSQLHELCACLQRYLMADYRVREESL